MLKRGLLTAMVLGLIVLAYFYAKALGSHSLGDESEGSAYSSPEVMTIAFGSCNRQNQPQGYWETIGSHQPDAWLWLGDNVYSDTEDMARMAADYATQLSDPDYAAFVAETPLMYGVWDDHDYGKNDAGAEWAVKREAKELMLEFLDVPADAAVRNYEGTYQAYRIGKIKVILLDTRYFRDELYPPVRTGDRYGPNPEGDVLGAAQWAWLESELTDSNASAHIIASSIQVLPTDHGYEKWANFPVARERLLSLLEQTRPAMPLLLSGDRHLAEFSVDSVNGYPIYEMTSSGLTHAYENAREANDKRIGSLITERNFGLLHFVPEGEELSLLAEVRAIDDNAVVASLSLPPGANKAALTALVQAKEPMVPTLKPCPESPNCVSTQSTQAKKRRDPIPFSGSVEEAKQRLKQVVGEMSRTRLVKDEENYLHYTFKTWPIPYTDDVEFVFDPEAKVIHYRSASRVGHSDLGVNSRRMKKVVEAYTSPQ